jgi:hypothetical protein
VKKERQRLISSAPARARVARRGRQRRLARLSPGPRPVRSNTGSSAV